MFIRRKPGISLKISVAVAAMIVGEAALVATLLDLFGPGARGLIIPAFVAGALLAGLLLALVLDALVTRPLLRLVRQVRTLPDRAPDAPFEISGIDEPRELGEALEAMRRAVVAREEELQRLNHELEARVEARTRDLERAQEQLLQAEKLASIGELAGGVAHEVNNPTGVILARASYLVSVADEEGFDPDVIEDLEVVVHQAERIRTITGDLLAFARRSGSCRGAVDLADVCALARNLLRHLATKRQVEVQVDAPQAVLVAGRRDALEQAVFNLLKNALEAVSEGGHVRVTARPAEAPGGPAVLLVDDDGPGVAPEHRRRVFDPFFTTKPTGQGTGLGLSVTYGIVTDHGGAVAVEDAPGGGARFRVTFPPCPPDLALETP